MDGISLSSRDKLLICLSVVVPPLATYLKFGKSRTLATNCLLTACLFIPGIIHAIKSIYAYPSVVFCKNEETTYGVTAREDSVIWEIPRDHFQSISDSIRVLEAQSVAFKSSNGPVQKRTTLPCLSQISASKPSLITAPDRGRSYLAHVDGSAPILNPDYGWSAAASRKTAAFAPISKASNSRVKPGIMLEAKVAPGTTIQDISMREPLCIR